MAPLSLSEVEHAVYVAVFPSCNLLIYGSVSWSAHPGSWGNHLVIPLHTKFSMSYVEKQPMGLKPGKASLEH